MPRIRCWGSARAASPWMLIAEGIFAKEEHAVSHSHSLNLLDNNVLPSGPPLSSPFRWDQASPAVLGPSCWKHAESATRKGTSW
jgi:hypothetical protein